MKHKIPCEIIRDILPLYVDELTSEVTNKEVEMHLAECEECRESRKRLKTDLEQDKEKKQAAGKAEIDYLKKVRRVNKKVTITGIVAGILIFLTVQAVRAFISGTPQSEYMVLYTNVYEDRVEIGGMCYGSAQAYCNYKLKEREDGSTELIIYTALPSPLNRSGSFHISLNFEDIGTAVNAGGVTVKPDGTVIGNLANVLYEAKNPYVGDVPADGRLVQALGLMNSLGTATIELHTAEEPYGWTFHFNDSVKNSITFDERMKAYACVLVALTDNLSDVSWTYTVELADGAQERTGSMTKEECSAYAGADIKTFGESPEKVQELLDILSLK